MRIIGKWKIVEAELGAERIPLDSLGKLVLEMDETSYQVIEEKVIESGLLELLSGASPTALHVKLVHGPNEGKTFQCIYRFDGPDLIMCYNLGEMAYRTIFPPDRIPCFTWRGIRESNLGQAQPFF